MDHALATLDCLGGHVDWSHGRPTIVPNGSGVDFGNGAGQKPLPFDARIVDGNLEVYGLGQSLIVTINDGQIDIDSGGLSSEWTEIRAIESESDAGVYYLCVYLNAANTDYTQEGNIRWSLLSASELVSETRKIPFMVRDLFDVKFSDKTITQHRRGFQHFNVTEGDSDALAFINNNTTNLKERSIERVLGGRLQIRNFNKAESTARIDPTGGSYDPTKTYLIVWDKQTGAIADTKYIMFDDLASYIENEIEPIGLDHEADVTGKLPEGLNEHYHLSEDQYDAIEGIILCDEEGCHVDHGKLNGLEDDDHPQYFKLDGRTGTDNDITVPTKITDETEAGEGAGALIVDGGIYAGNGVYAKSTNGYAGYFDGDVEVAGNHNVQTGFDYYHNEQQGVTTTNIVSGGIIAPPDSGGSIMEIDASDLQPTDKILVWRPSA
jgi:hypothetical protein